MDQAYGYTPLVKPAVTIPCLAPSEIECVNCGRTAPVDEIQWDLYDQESRYILCINCEDER
jgi:DNA-directed RNA polymerase subunit RPC12/RpoP